MKRVNLFQFTNHYDHLSPRRDSLNAVFMDDKYALAVASNRKVVLTSAVDFSQNYAGSLIWKDGVVMKNGVTNKSLNERLVEIENYYRFPEYFNTVDRVPTCTVPMPDMKELRSAIARGWKEVKDGRGADEVYIIIVKGGQRFAMLLRQAQLLAQLPADGVLYRGANDYTFCYNHPQGGSKSLVFDYRAAFFNERVSWSTDKEGVFIA